MAIRQTSGMVTIPNVFTGSAYATNDVVGNKFQIPLACGIAGGWLGTMNMIDYGSANAAIRVQLFREEPSAYDPSGVAFVLADADDDKWLGYADVTTWVSAGGAKMLGQVKNPGIALFSNSGSRHIWGVATLPNGGTIGAVADPLRIKMTTIQDTD